MIQTIVGVGKPVVVASDKEKTPSKVEKIAKSLGAHVYKPKKDLPSKKKKELGMGANDHELDAVASAKNAYNNLQREITKIKKHAEKTGYSEEKVAKDYFKKNKLPKKEEKEKNQVKQNINDQTSEKNNRKSKKDKEKKRLKRNIENLEEKIKTQNKELETIKKEKNNYKEKYRNLRQKKREEILKKEELSKKDGQIKRQKQKIQKLEQQLNKAKIREKEYVKAINHLYKGADILPLISKVENIPEEVQKAVLKENLEDIDIDHTVKEFYSREDVEGIELKNFFVVTGYPDPDFEQVIEQYRESRP